MKLSKNQWIAIIGILATLVAGFLGYQYLVKISVSGNDNAIAVGDNARATIVKVVNPLATFTSTHTFKQNSDGSYLVTINAVANNDYNLQNLLCVSINTNVKSNPAGRVSIKNNDSNLAQIMQSSTYTCLQQPSSHVTAYFWLESKPTVFEVNLSDKIPS